MKNKKILTVLGMIICLAAGSTAGVMAADEAVDDNKITFKAADEEDLEDDKPGDIKNPDENLEGPEEPIITNPGNQGHLAFVVVPSFQFGVHDIDTETDQDRIFYARGSRNGTAKDEVRPNFLQVRDITGSGDGYTVTAKMTKEFTSTTDPDNKFTSAYIDLTRGNVLAATGVDTPSYVAAARKLEKNSLVYIASADKKEGMGTAYFYYGDLADEATYDNSVKLTIPVGEKIFAEEYRATIEWGLTSGPKADEF